MKVGDEEVVTLRGFEVARAIVEDIQGDEVILILPATRIRMGLKTDLGDLPEQTPAVEHHPTVLPADGGTSLSEDEINRIKDLLPDDNEGVIDSGADDGAGTRNKTFDSSAVD